MQYILAIKLQMKYFGVSEILSHMFYVSVHLFYNSHALCTCNLIQEVHVHHASCGQYKEIHIQRVGF